MKRAHVFVEGYVQGVFFRYHTQKLAHRLGVRGWVRNLPDGRVEAVVEGEEKAINQMLEFFRRGPAGAFVEKVEVKWETPVGEYQDFEIRY